MGWEKVLVNIFLLNMTVQENVCAVIFQNVREEQQTSEQIETVYEKAVVFHRFK